MVYVTGHVKPSCPLSISDVNESCVLIITGSRILRETAVAPLYYRGGIIQQRSPAVYSATIQSDLSESFFRILSYMYENSLRIRAYKVYRSKQITHHLKSGL